MGPDTKFSYAFSLNYMNVEWGERCVFMEVHEVVEMEAEWVPHA
jgi:hypothetical protein